MDFKTFVIILFFILIAKTFADQDLLVPKGKKVGCHLYGNTRTISIPDCVEFKLTTNACLGYCESISVSSNFAIGPHRADHPPITSIGQCCNIMDSEEIIVPVVCLEGERILKFRSAKTCSCYQCKKT